MKREELQKEYMKTYDKGVLNHTVRAWFYLKNGLNLINEFKYLFAGIFALYYTFKLDDYRLMVLLFAISVPILTYVGWFYTHKMAKALEWTGMVFSSYFGRYQVDLNEKQAELLGEILSELKKKDNI
jgi:hypothetical protein